MFIFRGARNLLINKGSERMVQNLRRIRGLLMKIKQVLVVTGIAFQVVILSVTLFFLHEVNQKGDQVFEEDSDEMLGSSEVSLEKGLKIPFQYYVTGPGKVACSNYVKVNVKKEGIIEHLLVKEGDFVRIGDPILQVDQGMLAYTFREKIAEYDTALAELRLYENESSEEDPKEREKDVLKAVIRKKEVGMQAAQKAIADCKVSAPFEGRILKININPGEYIDPSETALIIGSDNPLHLKVLIDEKDMWRISPTKNLKAIALHRTNPSIHFVLDFVTVRPALGSIDTNEGKLEMVFAFDKGKAPLYLDQTLDVYIEAASPQDTSYLDYQFNQK